MRRRRLLIAFAGACVFPGVVLATAAWASRSSGPVTPLAVLHEHVDYEGQLLSRFVGRLSAPDARAAGQVLGLTSGLDARLATQLERRGYSGARAHAVWQRVIGDGVPPPSHALLYVCSIHAAESDTVALTAASPASVAHVLGNVELTLLLEGRQLATQLGDRSLTAAAVEDQRDALHALAPLLIPTDRAFAASA
jgi:hypothetical protein